MAHPKETAVAVLLGAAIILVLPLLNGGPFFYFDTATYIEQLAKAVDVLFGSETAAVTGQEGAAAGVSGASGGTQFGARQGDRIVVGGRSIYYSALAYAGWITTVWLPVAVQALTLSWLVLALLRHLGTRHWALVGCATLAGIAIFSSASLFAGLITPDIWAGPMILALALLWGTGDTLGRGERLVLLAVLSFAVLVHASHLALLAALVVLYGLGRLVTRGRHGAPLRPLWLPLAALAIGIGGSLAFSVAVRVLYGGEMLSLPFISAHLVELGPGTRLLRETCPQGTYALCAHLDRLPTDWISFLFDRSADGGGFATADAAQRRAIVGEQVRFALDTLAFDPVATVSGLVRDGVSQLWTLSMHDVALTTANRRFVTTSFPPDLARLIEGSAVFDNPWTLQALLRATQLTAALSAVLVCAWALGRARTPGAVLEGRDRVILVLVAGVVLNALICGILASPYGRFQARLVWLLPLGAALIIVAPTFRRARPLFQRQV